MKKLLLTSVVAGIFLAGCGENLPNEITSHENFKSCQQVEKNLLAIQSDFEKDKRKEFYKNCNSKFNDNEYSVYKDIINNTNSFDEIKAKIIDDNKKITDLDYLLYRYKTYFDVKEASKKLKEITKKHEQMLKNAFNNGSAK